MTCMACIQWRYSTSPPVSTNSFNAAQRSNGSNSGTGKSFTVRLPSPMSGAKNCWVGILAVTPKPSAACLSAAISAAGAVAAPCFKSCTGTGSRLWLCVPTTRSTRLMSSAALSRRKPVMSAIPFIKPDTSSNSLAAMLSDRCQYTWKPQPLDTMVGDGHPRVFVKTFRPAIACSRVSYFFDCCFSDSSSHSPGLATSTSRKKTLR